MAQIVHNTAVPNDGLGDALRQAFTDANTMNAELYATKVDKIAGKDLSKNDYTDIDKAKVDAINTAAEENVQSDWNELDPAEDSFILGKPIFSTTEIIVSALWTSGLSFDVIADSFPINGISYPATSGVVTLDTAHATLDRIDLIIATKPVSPATVGTVGKITGIPATTALVVPPDFDPSTQYVIKQVIVRDAATQPEGVSTTQIYNEGTEWAVVLSANIVQTTNDPSVGTVSLEATNNDNTDEIKFTAPAPISTEDIGTLTFDLKLKEAVGSQVIYVNFYLAGALILKYNFATPVNGFDGSNLGYQTITILRDKLVLPIQDFDEIIIRPFWASTGYFIDNFILHTGSGAETVPATGLPEAPNDGKTYGRKNEAWFDIDSNIFDGIDTTANILAKNPTLFLNQSWWSIDDKIVYKAITSLTQSSDNWIGVGVIYDESNDTYKLATTLDGQTQNLGQENFFQGFNDNGAGATALDPKLFLSTGSKSGEENIKNVLLAKASDLQAGSKYGLNTTEAGVGVYTKITTYGDINGVNTSAWLLNAQLYADTTSGELTDVKPSSDIFPVAKVDKVGTTDGILSVNTISAPAGETTAIPTGFDRVHYTADEVTLATGTYFLGKRNDTGIIGLDTTTAVCADDTQTAVAQEIVGTPIGFPISFQAGLYTAQVEFQVNGTQGEQRIRIEYYLAEADGTPIDSGILTEAIGVLGVRPALRTISQLLDAAANSPTFAILQGQLAQAVPLGATERVRTVIICEKVGTQGGDLTFTVSVGNLASSFTDTPALFEISDNIDVDTSGALTNNFLKLSASGVWLPTTIVESDLPSESVTKTGTPVNNQIPVFIDVNTIKGTPAMIYDGSIFNIDVAEVDNSVLNLTIGGIATLKGKTKVDILSDIEIIFGAPANPILTIDTVAKIVSFGKTAVSDGIINFHKDDAGRMDTLWDVANYYTWNRNGGGSVAGWRWTSFGSDIMRLTGAGDLVVKQDLYLRDVIATRNLTATNIITSKVSQTTAADFSLASFQGKPVATLNGGDGRTTIALSTSTSANFGYSMSAVRRASDNNSDMIWRSHLGSATGTETMRLTLEGNLGIGTKDPDVRLHITAGSYDQIKLSSSDTDLFDQRVAVLGKHDSNAEEEILMIGGFNDATKNLLFFGGGASIKNAATEIKFYTAANNTTLNGTARMTIESGGDIGIGTTTPAYRLDVTSSAGGQLARFKDSDSAHNGIIIAGDVNGGWLGNDPFITGEGIYFQNSSNAIRFYANGSEEMRLNSSGHLGIGISTPDGTLHVHTASAGTVVANASADDLVVENSSDSGINILSPDSSISTLRFGSPSDNSGVNMAWKFNDKLFTFGTSTNNGEIKFTTGNSVSAGFINDSQHWGFGTLIPLERVHIDNQASNGSGITRVMKIEAGHSDNDGGYIEFSASSSDGFGAQIGGMRTGGGGANKFFVRTGTSSQVERFSIDDAGLANFTEDVTAKSFNGTKKIKVTLSSAQLLALPTTVELIPAQGAGTVISILSIAYRHVFGTTAYSGQSTVFTQYGGTSSQQFSSGALLDSTVDKIATSIGSGAFEIHENQNFRITSASSPTLGDGTLDVYITYEIITL